MREISLVLGAALTGVLIVAAVLLGPSVAGAHLNDRPGVPGVVEVIDPSTAPKPAAVPPALTTSTTAGAAPTSDSPDGASQGAIPPGTDSQRSTPRQP
jgi:hypothetical protein